MNIFKFAKTILKPKSKSNALSLDKATCERLKIYENRFSSRLKKARTVAIIAFIVVFLAQFLAPVLMPAQKAIAGDTSSNAVIYGGVSSVAELQQKMAQGAGPNPAGGVYAPYQSPDHLQLLFHTLGIWENQFGTLQDGTVYKDGRVFVGNTLVGTSAISAGRVDFGGTVDITHMPGYNIYWRPTSVSFASNTLSALVFNNGSVVYAIIKDCGNPVRANPVVQPAPSQPAPVCDLSVSKTVSADGVNYADTISSESGAYAFYKIYVKNTGNTTLTNLMVKDNLPPKVSYVPDSTMLYNTNHPSGIKINDNIVSGGVNVGNYTPGASVRLVFKVKLDSDFTTGTHTLKNVGVSKADCTESREDYAWINIHVFKPAEITKSKSAINVTQNGVNAETVKAHAGDVIRYTLTTRNIGELPENNYVVQDNIADILQYADVTSTGGGTVNAGEITYPALDIAVGQTVNKTFEVTIKPEKDWPVSGDFVMTNVYGNIINVPVGFVELVLSKTAFNETQGVDATTVPAKPGDVIMYSLNTKNIGNEVKKDFIVSDDIADIMEYANVTDVGGGTVTNNIISWPEVDIDPGQTITKTFKVTIKPDSEWPTGGDLLMTNVYGNTINVPLSPPPPPGVLGAVTGPSVKGLATTGTVLNILFGTFILIASTYLYFRQRILLRLALLGV